MSRSLFTDFVDSKSSEVSGNLIAAGKSGCVLHVHTRATMISLHFHSLDELNDFALRVANATQSVADELDDPSDDTIVLGPAAEPVRVGGIDLSGPAGPLTVLPE